MIKIGMIALLLASGAASATPARGAAQHGMRVERIVLLMRHGVRPPTKAPAMPDGVASQPWPTWTVPPGWLTPHGAAAVRLVGGDDRAAFIAAGLLPARGCPTPASVRVIADSDQRTIATAEAYRDALAPGCTLAIEHRPQGEPDPLFSPDPDAAPLDGKAAQEAVIAAAGPGGLAGRDAQQRSTLARLDAVLCGDTVHACGIASAPTTLTSNAEGRPKLAGALDRGSTAAQILLLEYADGKPMAEVGWGRATAADVTRFSTLHALEFALVARPLPLARRNMAELGPVIRDALLAAAGPSITIIVGHDTNVASLAGLLGVHWSIYGFGADDPSPGGALILERVVDRQGARFLRVSYRSQTLEQIRSLQPIDHIRPAVRERLRIERCPAHPAAEICTIKQATALLIPSLR